MIFVMRDLLYLERVVQAETLLKPQRIEAPRRAARRRKPDPRHAPRRAASEPDVPSRGVSGEIGVRQDRRPEFMADLKGALQDLFTKYGGAEGAAFKLPVPCYPDRPHDE